MDEMTEIAGRAELEARLGTFLGGPPGRFIAAGRMQLDLLRRHGLAPLHVAVDIGAGPFRGGVWLMSYLDSGHYHALEPSVESVETGRHIAGPDLIRRANPKIDHNDQSDLSVFGVTFDYGIARSVWSHASMRQIRQLLESWSAGGHGLLFASYLPSKLRPYRGDSWVGISHESDTPGLVRHRLSDIRREAEKLGLRVERVPGWRMGGQRWLKVSA